MSRAASLTPGHGRVDLLGYATLERAGAALDLEANLHRNVSAFAQAWAGASRTDKWRPEAGALAGMRIAW